MRRYSFSAALNRDWFDLVLEGLIDPTFGLFKKDPSGKLQIDPTSLKRPKYLNYYKVVGRIHSMAILHGFLINMQLVPLLYPVLTCSTRSQSVSDKTALMKSIAKIKMLVVFHHFQIYLTAFF